MVDSNPLSSRKEKRMNKSPVEKVLKANDRTDYVVECLVNGCTRDIKVKGAPRAIEKFNFFRVVYGDNVRLVKVVLDYGEKV